VCANKNSDEVTREELTPVEHSRGYFRVGVCISRSTTRDAQRGARLLLKNLKPIILGAGIKGTRRGILCDVCDFVSRLLYSI